MNRKTAAAIAGALVLTVAAGTSAMAVNLGILDANASDEVGELEITPTSTPPPTGSTTTVPGTATTLIAPSSTAATNTEDRADAGSIGEDHKPPSTTATTQPQAAKAGDPGQPKGDDRRGRDDARGERRGPSTRSGPNGRGDDD